MIDSIASRVIAILFGIHFILEELSAPKVKHAEKSKKKDIAFRFYTVFWTIYV